MKTKLVTRYICEFCGKKNYSRQHMEKHELHCTMNPHRVCGMCKIAEHDQQNLEAIKTAIPEVPELPTGEIDIFGTIYKPVDDAMPRIRELAGNCPACTLAALRQQKIPIPAIHAFNFTKECEAFWIDINDAKSEWIE